jgi:hypothetical protein
MPSIGFAATTGAALADPGREGFFDFGDATKVTS